MENLALTRQKLYARTQRKICETGWDGARVTKAPAIVSVAQGRRCQAGHCTSSSLGCIAGTKGRVRSQVDYCAEVIDIEVSKDQQLPVCSAKSPGKFSSVKVSIDADKTKLQLHRKGGARFPLRIAT